MHSLLNYRRDTCLPLGSMPPYEANGEHHYADDKKKSDGNGEKRSRGGEVGAALYRCWLRWWFIGGLFP
ncbi:MAG TPA: hypothetical protein VMX96_10475 [Dehalococcoidia bacterium]|nr:hypothetical protein [Dehalococcoidia bacterium]